MDKSFTNSNLSCVVTKAVLLLNFEIFYHQGWGGQVHGASQILLLVLEITNKNRYNKLAYPILEKRLNSQFGILPVKILEAVQRLNQKSIGPFRVTNIKQNQISFMETRNAHSPFFTHKDC